ncbi:MAG: VCBS repeat-containing protein [Acidobacteriota bacterium]
MSRVDFETLALRLGLLVAFACLLALLPAVPVWAQAVTVEVNNDDDEPAAEGEPPPPVETLEAAGSGIRLWQAVLPGRSRSIAASNGGLVVLLSPEGDSPEGGDEDDSTDEGPRELWRVSLDGQPPHKLRGDLSKDLDILHAPSRDVLWMSEGGRIFALEDVGGGTPRQVLDVAGLELRSLEGGGLVSRASGAPLLAVPEVGRLRLFAADDPRSALRPVAEAPLPVAARRIRRGLDLTSPRVTALAGQADGAAPYLAGPTAEGRTRLRCQLLDPRAADPEQRSREAWCRLPGPENVEGSWYLAVDGRPMLAVVTTRADRLGAFETLKLRLFPLRADRTRAGAGATLAIETDSRRWFEVEPVVQDLDGDGKDDLMLVQPEGMGGGELRVDAWKGRGSGRFERKSRRIYLELPGARWSFDHDFNGDGLKDLVAVAEGQLAVHGALANHRKRPVEKEPRWMASPTELLGQGGFGSRGQPRPVDLDGDGRPELVTVHHRKERAVVHVVQLD